MGEVRKSSTGREKSDRTEWSTKSDRESKVRSKDVAKSLGGTYVQTFRRSESEFQEKETLSHVFQLILFLERAHH